MVYDAQVVSRTHPRKFNIVSAYLLYAAGSPSPNAVSTKSLVSFGYRGSSPYMLFPADTLKLTPHFDSPEI
jgi:hypothetical protein